jgi:serine/threonine protein kinase
MPGAVDQAALASVALRSQAGTTVRVLVHDEALHGVVEETFPAAASVRAQSVVRALEAVRHPNLAPIVRAEPRGGALVVATELVHGERLDELVAASNAALSLPVRLRILVDVLAGLSAVHETGTALRCLGPAHVIVGADGIARIVHVARAALAPSALSPDLRAYVAPELRDGGEPSPRGDVWSAAMLLAESLARREGGALLGEAALRAGVEDAAWAAPLVPLALRALSTDPAARPATPAELAAAVRLVVRSRLASHERVARELEQYAGERLQTRRTAWLRASGKVRVAGEPSPFEAPTSPVGMRTLEDVPVEIEAPARALVFEPTADPRPAQESVVFFDPEHEPHTIPPSAVDSMPPDSMSPDAMSPDAMSPDAMPAPQAPPLPPEQSVTGAQEVRGAFESTGGLLVPPIDASAVEPTPAPPARASSARRVLVVAAVAVVAIAAAAVLAIGARSPAVALHPDAASTLHAEPPPEPLPTVGAAAAAPPPPSASVRPAPPAASAVPPKPLKGQPAKTDPAKTEPPKSPRDKAQAPYNPSSI